VYACCGTSPHGQPVEAFVIDPAMPFDVKPFRSPMFAQRQDGLYDVIVWVGAAFYPTVPDFVEEVRNMGVSRRISAHAKLDCLTPTKSRMVFVHARAIAPQLDLPESAWCRAKGQDHVCTFHLWPLSALMEQQNHRVAVEGQAATVRTPNTTYQVSYPQALEGREIAYQVGVFAAFPITHFEYVTRKQQPVVPEKILTRINRAGYELLTCHE
jgi:hypothetical protein